MCLKQENNFSGINNIKQFFSLNKDKKQKSIQMIYNSICNNMISKFIFSVLSSEEYKSFGTPGLDQLFINFCNAENKDKCSSSVNSEIMAEHDVSLRSNSFLAFPWRRDSLSDKFEKMAADGFIWETDVNHTITLVKPFNIYYVNGGNHSIACGKFFNKEGIIKCETAIDYTKILLEYDYDGEHFVNKKGEKINKPFHMELLNLFILGKAMVEMENDTSI